MLLASKEAKREDLGLHGQRGGESLLTSCFGIPDTLSKVNGDPFPAEAAAAAANADDCNCAASAGKLDKNAGE